MAIHLLEKLCEIIKINLLGGYDEKNTLIRKDTHSVSDVQIGGTFF